MADPSGRGSDSAAAPPVLAELRSLDGVQQPISRTTRVKYTCVAVCDRFLAVGANTGGVYFFERRTLRYLQVVSHKHEYGAATCLRFAADNNHLAVGFAKGFVTVWATNLRSLKLKEKQLAVVTDLRDSPVVDLAWDDRTMVLFAGDERGWISQTRVKTSHSKALFNSTEIVYRAEHVVQLSFCETRLLVSTRTRCFVLDTEHQKCIPVGSKPRDGAYGACIVHPAGRPTSVVFAARPGSRVWEASPLDGSVVSTLPFKPILSSMPSSPLVSVSRPQLVGGAQGHPSVVFSRLQCTSEGLLVAYADSRVFLMDPVATRIVAWLHFGEDTHFVSMTVTGNTAYLITTASRLHELEVLLPRFCASRLYAVGAFVQCAAFLWLSDPSVRNRVLERILLELRATVAANEDACGCTIAQWDAATEIAAAAQLKSDGDTDLLSMAGDLDAGDTASTFFDDDTAFSECTADLDDSISRPTITNLYASNASMLSSSPPVAHANSHKSPLSSSPVASSPFIPGVVTVRRPDDSLDEKPFLRSASSTSSAAGERHSSSIAPAVVAAAVVDESVLTPKAEPVPEVAVLPLIADDSTTDRVAPPVEPVAAESFVDAEFEATPLAVAVAVEKEEKEEKKEDEVAKTAEREAVEMVAAPSVVSTTEPTTIAECEITEPAAPIVELAGTPEGITDATPEPASEIESTPEPVTALTPEPTPEPASEPTSEPVAEPTPEPASEPTSEPVAEPTPEPASEPTPEPASEPTPEPAPEPISEPVAEPTPEPACEPISESVAEPTPEPASEPISEPVAEPTPEPASEPISEPVAEPTPETASEPTLEPEAEPTPEAAPEPISEPASEPAIETLSKPVTELTPEPASEPVHEMSPVLLPESATEPAPEPTREPTLVPPSESTREPTPEPQQPIASPSTSAPELIDTPALDATESIGVDEGASGEKKKKKKKKAKMKRAIVDLDAPTVSRASLVDFALPSTVVLQPETVASPSTTTTTATTTTTTATTTSVSTTPATATITTRTAATTATATATSSTVTTTLPVLESPLPPPIQVAAEPTPAEPAALVVVSSEVASETTLETAPETTLEQSPEAAPASPLPETESTQEDTTPPLVPKPTPEPTAKEEPAVAAEDSAMSDVDTSPASPTEEEEVASPPVMFSSSPPTVGSALESIDEGKKKRSTTSLLTTATSASSSSSSLSLSSTIAQKKKKKTTRVTDIEPAVAVTPKKKKGARQVSHILLGPGEAFVESSGSRAMPGSSGPNSESASLAGGDLADVPPVEMESLHSAFHSGSLEVATTPDASGDLLVTSVTARSSFDAGGEDPFDARNTISVAGTPLVASPSSALIAPPFADEDDEDDSELILRFVELSRSIQLSRAAPHILRDWLVQLDRFSLGHPRHQQPRRSGGTQDVSPGARECISALLWACIETGAVGAATSAEWDDVQVAQTIERHHWWLNVGDTAVLCNRRQAGQCLRVLRSIGAVRSERDSRRREVDKVLSASRTDVRRAVELLRQFGLPDGLPFVLGHLPRLFALDRTLAAAFCADSHPYVLPHNVISPFDGEHIDDNGVIAYLSLLLLDESNGRAALGYRHDGALVQQWVQLCLRTGAPPLDTVVAVGDGEPCAQAHKAQWRYGSHLDRVVALQQGSGCDSGKSLSLLSSSSPGYTLASAGCGVRLEAEWLLRALVEHGYWPGVVEMLLGMGGQVAAVVDILLSLSDADYLFAKLHGRGLKLQQWVDVLTRTVERSENGSTGVTVTEVATRLTGVLGPHAMSDALTDLGDAVLALLPTSFPQWLLSVCRARNKQEQAVQELLEAVDSHLWSHKTSALPTQAQWLVAAETAIAAGTASQETIDFVQKCSVVFEIDTPLPRGLEEASSHWGVTMARMVGEACPFCQLPLNERLGLTSTLLVFGCGHVFHRACLTEGACALCFQRHLSQQHRQISSL